MKEPSVSIQMIVQDIANNTVAGQNIACGTIIADCGTLTPRMFYNSTQVLREFTKSGTITRSTDTTLIHAAAIADIMPVFLKRSYADNGVRAGFGIFKKATSTSLEHSVRFDKITETNLKDDTDYKAVDGDNSIIANGKTISLSDGHLKFHECKFTFSAPYSKLVLSFNTSGVSSSIDYLILTDASGNEEYISRSRMSWTQNDLTIDLGDIQDASTSLTVVLTGANTAELTSINFIKSEKSTFNKLLFKNGIPFKYVADGTISDTSSVKDFLIRVGNTVYYNAINNAPRVTADKEDANAFVLPEGVDAYAIEGISRLSTMKNVIDAINAVLQTEYIDYANGTGTIKIYSMTSLDAVNNDRLYDSYESSTALGEEKDYSMYLFLNSPSSINYTAKVIHDPDDENLIDVTVVTPNRTYEYTGSTDPEYVNEYGANQFIENVNQYDNIPFHIEVVGTTSEAPVLASSILETPTLSFGSMNVADGRDIATRRAAFIELMDDDEVKPAFACPFGYNNDSYLLLLNSYGPKNWVFTPIGMFVDKDDPEAIVAKRPSVKSDYAIVMAPHDKSTIITDWVTNMSLEVAYLRKIESNKAKMCEFAPMMGKVNATLEITAPSVKFKKSTREALLDANIMSLITRSAEDASWLNKNVCSGGHNTILSEDQNIRLACKINRDLDTLMEPILGKFNIEETRSRIITTIRTYFNNNILNQIYSIDSYNPVCDATNNPPEIRANNQLIIDLSVTYLNAIYDILIYHRALDVSSSEA